MLNGKEKVQLLLNLLGPLSQNVLTKLSSESANQLTTNIENTPIVSDEDLKVFLDEILTKAEILAEEEEKEQVIEEKIIPEPAPETKPKIEPVTEIKKPKQKNAVEIAKVISEQKPRIIAFLLSKLDEELANEVKTLLSSEILDSLQTIEVEYVPYSDKIYESLCKQFFENNN